MPMPIIIFAAQAAAEVAGTSIWVYVGGGAGTLIGGGSVYYYRDSIYHWWYPKACEALPENDPIKKQSTIIQDARNSTDKTQAKIEKTLEEKASIVIDVKQNAKKTEEVVTELQNISVVEKKTFESLLQKITEGKSEKLDNVLSELEQIKDSLTFNQVGTIKSVIKMAEENQLYRDADSKKDKIICKLEKINFVLKERLMAFEGALKEENSSNTIFRKD